MSLSISPRAVTTHAISCTRELPLRQRTRCFFSPHAVSFPARGKVAGLPMHITERSWMGCARCGRGMACRREAKSRFYRCPTRWLRTVRHPSALESVRPFYAVATSTYARDS